MSVYRLSRAGMGTVKLFNGSSISRQDEYVEIYDTAKLIGVIRLAEGDSLYLEPESKIEE
jgi:hypothetical protein